jgi:hypothetical protein
MGAYNKLIAFVILLSVNLVMALATSLQLQAQVRHNSTCIMLALAQAMNRTKSLRKSQARERQSADAHRDTHNQLTATQAAKNTLQLEFDVSCCCCWTKYAE